MKPVPTQKGNPHNLVRWQHIFPNYSISRFCSENGMVDLDMLKIGRRRFAKPNDKMFCVERAWDERAEKGYGKGIEDAFQKVVDVVLHLERPLLPSENLLVTEFYCLWTIRYHWSHRIHVDDRLVRGMQGNENPLTLDDQERLEKVHTIYTNDDGIIPARQICGLGMQRNIDAHVEFMADVEWGILYAFEGEFVVPDNFLERRILPITPNVCFVAEHESGMLDRENVGLINAVAVKSAERYLFARDLDNCPGYVGTS